MSRPVYRGIEKTPEEAVLRAFSEGYRRVSCGPTRMSQITQEELRGLAKEGFAYPYSYFYLYLNTSYFKVNWGREVADLPRWRWG